MSDTKQTNPLLERVSIPGESFKLPSGGLFYKDELDSSVKNGEIYVRPMTAVEELVLKSPDKLLSGEAIPEIFHKCIVDVKDPDNLLAKDVDFLLMCLRLVSYGPTIDVPAKHDCENAEDHTYEIELRPLLQSSKLIDPTTLKTFELKLDNGQVIALHPPRYMSTVKLYQTFSMDNDEDLSSEDMGLRLLESVSDMISSVDGHEDTKDIAEWLQHIRAGDVQLIAEKISELSDWGINPQIEVECRDCKKKMEVVVPINPISFFT
jgi:hypothetical protein